jgi:hypothetical protein
MTGRAGGPRPTRAPTRAGGRTGGVPQDNALRRGAGKGLTLPPDDSENPKIPVVLCHRVHEIPEFPG